MIEDKKPYRHGNQQGTLPRVRINPTIDVETESQIRVWASKQLSLGQVIDQVVDHAKSTSYFPRED